MARTRKKFPWEWNSVFRTPKGKQAARRGNARKGAIPPDAWDDKFFDKQCWLPMKIADRLLKQGWDPYAVIRHLVKNYNLTQRTAREVVEMESYCRHNWPEGVAVVYKEERVNDFRDTDGLYHCGMGEKSPELTARSVPDERTVSFGILFRDLP